MSNEVYGFDDPDFAEENMLPEGCGYQGYEFGAGSYPDSICFGGRLYDADNYDNGMYRDPMEFIPCPMCRPKDAIADYKRQNLIECYTTRAGRIRRHSKRHASRLARSLVRDIRRNRKDGTEPWKAKAAMEGR